jgi:hypothetical protein
MIPSSNAQAATLHAATQIQRAREEKSMCLSAHLDLLCSPILKELQQAAVEGHIMPGQPAFVDAVRVIALATLSQAQKHYSESEPCCQQLQFPCRFMWFFGCQKYQM